MQEETLEQVAHKILTDYGIKSMGQSIGVLEVKKLMVKMAKWQQDKGLYSEEDMLKCFHAGAMYCATENKVYERSPDFKEWLEQFKKQIK